MKHSLATMLLLCCITLPAFAEEAADDLVRSISVNGEGKVEIAPDKATMHVTVYTENKNLPVARKENEGKVKKLLGIAQEFGLKDEHIKTLYANVEPKYRYEENTNKQILEGYTVSNEVELTLLDPSKLSTIFNQLVEGGFDRIGSVDFDLQHREVVEQEAMLKAVKNARLKADKIATEIGDSITEVLAVQEGGSSYVQPPMPYRHGKAMLMSAAMDSAESSNTMPSGLIEVRQNVSVTYGIK